MTERTKIIAIAHVLPGLERAWLQHMRDFDTAHPGCHFELMIDGPDTSLAEMLEVAQLNPPLTFVEILKRHGRS